MTHELLGFVVGFMNYFFREVMVSLYIYLEIYYHFTNVMTHEPCPPNVIQV